MDLKEALNNSLIPKVLECQLWASLWGISMPALGLHTAQKSLCKHSFGGLQSQWGLGGRWGLCSGLSLQILGLRAALLRAEPRGARRCLSELSDFPPSAYSDPLFKFSTCLSFHKIINTPLFLELCLGTLVILGALIKAHRSFHLMHS